MPSPREWQDHKTQILALIAENPLVTVVKEMKRRGFTASTPARQHAANPIRFDSKAQYEHHLIEWDTRKNLKQGEWRTAVALYDRLVSLHGERNVRLLISDIPVLKKRITKNRYRYCRQESTYSGAAGQLPRAVSFQILSANGDWVPPPADELRNEHDPSANNSNSSNLPFLPAPSSEPSAREDGVDAGMLDQDEDFDPLAFPLPSPKGPAIPPLAVPPPVIPPGVTIDPVASYSPFAQMPISPRLFGLISDGYPTFTAIDIAPKTPTQLLNDLGFRQFEKRLLEATGVDLQNLHITQNHFLQSPTIQFLSCIAISQHSPFNVANINIANHHYLHSLLQPFTSLLPGGDSNTTGTVASFDANVHRLLLFSLSNGFAGLEMIDLARMLGFLSQYKNVGALLTQLKSIPGHYRKALVEGVFKMCVESGEAQVAQQLLKLQCFDVNTIICTHNGKRLTPLERASGLQDANMVQTLLANRADANKTFDPRTRSTTMGPLRRLIDALVPNTIISPEAESIISQLLEAGLRVTSDDLKYFAQIHARDAITQLALRFLDQDHETFISSQLLRFLASELDQERFSRILNGTLDKCNEIHQGRCRVQFGRHFHKALVRCAIKGYSQPAQTLLQHHADPASDVLCGAIRGAHKNLVELILSEYAPSFDCEAVIDEYMVKGTTPLAEAIQAKDADLIRICEEGGSLACLHQGCHFESAIDAAASTGNIEYVRKLLDLIPHPEPLALYEPLVNAIEGGYKKISYMLLEAGAHISKWSGPVEKHPLFAAMIHGDHSLVHAILDLDFEPGSNVLGYEIEGRDGNRTTVICELVRMGDRSLLIEALTIFPDTISKMSTNELQNFITHCDEETLRLLLGQKSLRGSIATARLGLATRRKNWTMVHEMLDCGANPGSLEVLFTAADTSQELFEFLLQKVPQSAIPFLDEIEDKSHGSGAWGANLLQHLIKKGVSGLPLIDILIGTEKLDIRYLPLYARTTALGVALRECREGHSHGFSAVKKLLEAGCDPNTVAQLRDEAQLPSGDQKSFSRSSNLTPLLSAIEVRSVYLVELLLSKGADVNGEAVLGVQRTPLQLAAQLGCLDIVKLLLSRNADVNAAPARRAGGTALQLAAISGNCNIASELLEHGADLHQAPRVLGRWPLEGAAEHGRLEMIEYLWRVSGVGFSDKICDRAMELAGENGHWACQDCIRELKMSKPKIGADMGMEFFGGLGDLGV